MNVNTDYSKIIVEYIEQHFPNAAIEQWEHEQRESINFKILEGEKIYVLRVMTECLIDLSASEVNIMLANYNVAQIIRDVGDFPVVVTNYGCIFGSP